GWHAQSQGSTFVEVGMHSHRIYVCREMLACAMLACTVTGTYVCRAYVGIQETDHFRKLERFREDLNEAKASPIYNFHMISNSPLSNVVISERKMIFEPGFDSG
ncbi:hypothetical protein L9F63_015573, partial [Diploptera punctata]